jgi:hypothetical protein
MESLLFECLPFIILLVRWNVALLFFFSVECAYILYVLPRDVNW